VRAHNCTLGNKFLSRTPHWALRVTPLDRHAEFTTEHMRARFYLVPSASFAGCFSISFSLQIQAGR